MPSIKRTSKPTKPDYPPPFLPHPDEKFRRDLMRELEDIKRRLTQIEDPGSQVGDYMADLQRTAEEASGNAGNALEKCREVLAVVERIEKVVQNLS